MKLRSLLWLSLLGLAACDGDGDDTDATPPGPVCAYFSGLSPSGGWWVGWGEGLSNTCEPPPPEGGEAGAGGAGGAPAEPEIPEVPQLPELVIGCDRQLGVDVKFDDEADNWTFRQPGACGSSPQCGYLVVELDAQADAPPALCSPGQWPDPPDDSGLPDPGVTACGASALNTVLLDLGSFRDLTGWHELRATLMNAESRTPFSGFGPIYLSVALSAEDCSTSDDAG